MKTYSFAAIMLAELREKRDIARNLSLYASASERAVSNANPRSTVEMVAVSSTAQRQLVSIASINGQRVSDLGASWRKGWGI